MPTIDEARKQQVIEGKFKELGFEQFQSVKRFFAKFQSASTRKNYSISLTLYVRWLREIGVTLTPDELIKDNLVCIFKSDPIEVETKRKHTNWLDQYVNDRMVKEGYSDSARNVASSVVRTFYEKNDSPLFGSFEVAKGKLKPPPAAVSSEEIRKVLKALPLAQRVPLLMEWQSSIEINRILCMTWEQVKREEYPLKIELFGRKRHRRTYFTFLGRDSIEHLKIWKEKWTELNGRAPGPEDIIFMGQGGPMDPNWLNRTFKETAMKLARQGLIVNSNKRSWHTHMLRHSFKTEAEHAEVKRGVVEFFMGHTGGISWVYDHTDELHASDMVDNYKRLEPFVSLDYVEQTIREELEGTNRQMLEIITDLQMKVARLESQSAATSSDAQVHAESRVAHTEGP